MRNESVIFIILLWIFLSAGCAENGAEESEPSGPPAETPVLPAEVPQPPAEIVETPGNTPSPTPIENLTLPEQEPLPEDPTE
jgi:PBP1b-binding outer membrane lipoprotein LpoB